MLEMEPASSTDAAVTCVECRPVAAAIKSVAVISNNNKSTIKPATSTSATVIIPTSSDAIIIHNEDHNNHHHKSITEETINGVFQDESSIIVNEDTALLYPSSSLPQAQLQLQPLFNNDNNGTSSSYLQRKSISSETASTVTSTSSINTITMTTTPSAALQAKILWWNAPPRSWTWSLGLDSLLDANNDYGITTNTNNVMHPNNFDILAPAPRSATVSPKQQQQKSFKSKSISNNNKVSSLRRHNDRDSGIAGGYGAINCTSQEELELDNYSQNLQLLAKNPESNIDDNDCNGNNNKSKQDNSQRSLTVLLNPSADDEMLITGYRRSMWRTICCWICICLTAGILRLVMHWWRHWYLIATHTPCSLAIAEMVLIEENYQGNHKLFYVKTVECITVTDPRIIMEIERQRRQYLEKQHSNMSNELMHSPTNSRHQREKKQSALPGNEPPIPSVTDGMMNKMYMERQLSSGKSSQDFKLSVHFSSAQFKYSDSVRLFTCKQLRYAWDTETQNFMKISGLDDDIDNIYYHQQRGLTEQEQLSRRLVYGPNEITVPYKSVQTLLFLEVLNPFYVFQIFSVILWFTYDYYYYACVIVLMSVFGITMSILQTRKNQNALRATVQNTGHATVLGEMGKILELPTQQLVPGDIIVIPSDGCVMQCDAILLSGNCVLDESMLTGESVPVTKTPLPNKRDIIYDKKEHARHTLFCGTKVIQTRYFGSAQVRAIVTNTGNITAKGGLIRSILYPPPVDYKFEQDSYKFIGCLALIALVGFTYTLVSKILRQVDAVKIVVESLDLITIVVPPALPAAMTVGRFYAQKRLERKNIYCISPRSINVAGGIDCCCFDKTGTLTEDGLDMWGVVPISITNEFQIPIKNIDRLPADNFLFGMVTCHSITIMNGKRVGDPLDLKMFESTGWLMEDANDVDDSQKFGLLQPTIVRAPKQQIQSNDVLASNVFGGSIEQIATQQRQSSLDDLLHDVGLLDGETQNDHGIVREFPFTSSLQRMSVITRRLSDRHFTVYCKGSPEKLQQLCMAQTLPTNYTQQLAIFAKQGFRVIAMAYKPLGRKFNYTRVQRITRENVESDLQFLGFVILENRLKPDTSDVIETLMKANIRTVMVTGDNILTAVSVARDCGIVTTNQAVITVHTRRQIGDVHMTSNGVTVNETKSANQFELYYTLEPGIMPQLDVTASNSMRMLKGGGDMSLHTPNDNINNEDTANVTLTSELPLSGSLCSIETMDRWSVMPDDTATTISTLDAELGIAQQRATAATIIRDSNLLQQSSWRQNYCFAMTGDTWQIVREHFPQQLKYFITRGAIFARMSPEQKQGLIVELQAIDYCVAMCGDGANDCGALKVAHTGISLSETESSIASPFTSCNPTIACVPNVIREGRAALVTSFGIFKYMAAYSMVQFISVMILYSIDSNLTDKQYLYIDLGLISVFAFFFGKTAAYAGPLHCRVPLSSLISLMPLGSLILHLLVVVVFQVTGWFQLHAQDWFTPFVLNSEDHLGCYENYTMFAISSFQYIILAFVFSKGKPYRRAIWSNTAFCLSLLINLALVIYLVLYPQPAIAHFFQLIIPPTMGFRYWMIIYGIAAFVVHCIIEMVFVEMLLFWLSTRNEQNNTLHAQIEGELKHYQTWPQIMDSSGSMHSPTLSSQQHSYSGGGGGDEEDKIMQGQSRVTSTPGESNLIGGGGTISDARGSGTGTASDMYDDDTYIQTPNYVELSVQPNFDVITPTSTGLTHFFR